MDLLRERLIRTRVIDDVVDDFNPRVRLIVTYGFVINFGVVLSSAEVLNKPDSVSAGIQTGDQETRDMLSSGLVLIMTNVDAHGREHLNWMVTIFGNVEQETMTYERVPYEPPRANAHRVVFTLYKLGIHSRRIFPDSWRIFPDILRELFTTRAFANINALGSPLGATMFYINN